MERFGDETPSADDREWHASRIETYTCQKCYKTARFPRYNHPQKLFETRTGRCGEYANAFTCLCVALGHEAREVHDWTDHVWTEVWIHEYNRWVHMDSCEPIFDAPLTYEKGWGKQLTYLIATSNSEIIDVSPRYVLNRMMNKMRRDKVNEEWLADTIRTKREQMWEMQGPEKKQILMQRYADEQKEFQKDPKIDEELAATLLPRQSGSKEWRESRGEMNNKGNSDVMSMMAGFSDVEKAGSVQQKVKEVI